MHPSEELIVNLKLSDDKPTGRHAGFGSPVSIDTISTRDADLCPPEISGIYESVNRSLTRHWLIHDQIIRDDMKHTQSSIQSEISLLEPLSREESLFCSGFG
jgi:hypothetical protein